MNNAICSGIASTAVIHQASVGNASGEKRYMTNGIRIAGRFPSRVRSSRQAARPAAASMTRTIAEPASQLYRPTRASSQAIR